MCDSSSPLKNHGQPLFVIVNVCYVSGRSSISRYYQMKKESIIAWIHLIDQTFSVDTSEHSVEK